MSAWAMKRQILSIGFIFAIFVGGLYLIYDNFFSVEASCFDGIVNGNEEGVDCGGGCDLVCPFRAVEPNVLWSRSFEIIDGVYNAVALVENPNFDLQVTQAYLFQLYNDDNVLIEEITGFVVLEPSEIRPIFEPSVNVGERKVGNTFFRFTGEPIVEAGEEVKKNVIVRSRRLSDEDTEPELYVTLYNQSIRPERDLELVAVLYDSQDNVVQSSKTFVEFIDRDSETDAFFTWPEPFDQSIRKIDVFVISPK